MTTLDHPSISKMAAALREAGMAAAADGIRILDDEVRTAAAAAAALGVEVGAIANSLVFRATHGDEVAPLLALTSGAHRADTVVLARLAGADEVGKADPAFVREHTGQAIGGVAPVGHPRPIQTIVDRDLAGYAVVWAAAGHPKSVFPTTYADLLALTGGAAADVAGQEENHTS
ncbi:YbaK/EbsC family protein [Actinophytocola oryzae]|uniref:Prolyl-tRNA editing enzyme YbaK/EbsC (Cys-tRNA(Pro) deacylase) n=1 Tax=Actinophytocola oryzae TaxID=502181 RepID=A0A4R7UWE6_9PSEU|nr:YbaK/EbsC family protein [Actinophytocola oryzae]TDV40377.1 prolyl-tRNA editing enzyme YbaK/EbsC (Cys-tRNA(Pro) deacylase) [Actinophytocola oryzae]